MDVDVEHVGSQSNHRHLIDYLSVYGDLVVHALATNRR